MMPDWIRNFLDRWRPDRGARRMAAQYEAMEDLRCILDNTDMRLGQTISVALGDRDLFYITDEDMADALDALCARLEL